MKKIVKRLKKSPIIPVLTFEDTITALKVSEALIDGGLSTLEITLRTKKALMCIDAIKKSFKKDVCVGAGTVLEKNQIDRLKELNVDFMVSPGFTKKLVLYAKKQKIPYLPGVSTPREVMELISLDVKFMKFFHASMQGGVKSLGVYKSLFPKVRFCPTGGIGDNDYKEYLKLQNVFCVGGSWMVSGEDIANKNFDLIRKKAKKIVESF